MAMTHTHTRTHALGLRMSMVRLLVACFRVCLLQHLLVLLWICHKPQGTVHSHPCGRTPRSRKLVPCFQI